MYIMSRGKRSSLLQQRPELLQSGEFLIESEEIVRNY